MAGIKLIVLKKQEYSDHSEMSTTIENASENGVGSDTLTTIGNLPLRR